MQKIKNTILIIFLSIIIWPSLSIANNKDTLYYGNACQHCAKVKQFINKNQLKEKIILKEVYHNTKNAQEFNNICERHNISLMDRGVPFLYTHEHKCIIGDKEILSYLKQNKINNAPKSKNDNKILTIPLLIGASLVDAINPCAFAVLLILMTTILATQNKKRALLAGLFFSVSIFISYLLMGFGLYSVIANFKVSFVFIKIIASLAIILGLLNLKDFFWYGKAFLMEVPLRWRPKLKKLIQSITSPLVAFLIGFLISLFLLPCTSGPYIVIIGMLGNSVTHFKAIQLLILYNFIFILPMLGITIASYYGMNIQKAEEERKKNLKNLHLIAGIIMLAMGIYLLFN